MTTEVNPESVTVELSAESAYEQLVSFQQAVADFNKADDADDKDAMLAAANDAVDSCLGLINEIVPRDLSEKLHARLQEEHPDLVPAEDPMIAILRELFGADVQF
ncbi:MAG TPA: hypothetical protein VHS28_03520 [Chloroflexota bacterium]|nr:hypothetical protein [Chloroflexota bacterium]